MPTFDDFADLDAARASSGITSPSYVPHVCSGLISRRRITGIGRIKSERNSFSNERQGGLFDEAAAKKIATLRKEPLDFHYRYACKIGDVTHEYRHKIVDWELARSTGPAAPNIGTVGRLRSGLS